MLRITLAGLLLFSLPGSLFADLPTYLQKPEPAYAWKLKEKQATSLGTIYDLELTSQAWEGIVWRHQLQVYQPAGAKPQETMLLWNTGGRANAGNIGMAMTLAQKIQAPVAFLYHIPNQPLFDGKTEDALIAETFVRYLNTKDEDWPLLFPMVKSVVKAMDALQEFSRQEWQSELKSFVISGASKRGWTTWLTGASDKRVKAIAPLVIDTLNMREQMPHQLQAFGRYSEMIGDYTRRGLVPVPNTPEAKKLWMMVDPYLYRDKLTMPKMIINGNNDPYWTVDALNLYWDSLKGDKYIVYVPNAGHNLQQKDASGRPDRTRAINALAAFARAQITGKPLPNLAWTFRRTNEKAEVSVLCDGIPKGRIWFANAASKDFRRSEWKEKRPDTALLSGSPGITVIGSMPPPSEGYGAFYAEFDFELDGIPYHLCTQLSVIGKDKK
jgi:PhoPQ-activated pathogenicity-related protein